MSQFMMIALLVISSAVALVPAGQSPPETIDFVPGTAELTGPAMDELERTVAQAVDTGVVPEHAYYSISSVREESGWSFVSLVGLDQLDPVTGWSVHDAEWFGLALLRSSHGHEWRGALRGTEAYSRLLAGAPGHIVSPDAKLGLDPLARSPEQAGEYRFPWEPGTMMAYGSFGVHVAEEAGRVAVDFMSNGDTALGHAPNRVLAMESGIIDWVCEDEFQVGFRIGDLFYLHLAPNVAIFPGASLTLGQDLGQLRSGDFSTQCGWAQQPAGWFHLHLTFPDGESFQIEEWTLDIESQTWHWEDEVRTPGGWHRDSWLPTCIATGGTWEIDEDALSPGESATISRGGGGSGDAWYGGMGVSLLLEDNSRSFFDLGFHLVGCDGDQPDFLASITIPDEASSGPATIRVDYDGISSEIPILIEDGAPDPPDPGDNPEPVVTGVTPDQVQEGAPEFTLQVTGEQFVEDAVVRWNGADRPTTFVNSTRLDAEISAADIETAGTAEVTVYNPPPGGGESSAVPVLISPVVAGNPDLEPVCTQDIELWDYERVWARTDLPVVEGQVARTWMWGPVPFSCTVVEPYVESPGGSRTVLYFDKSRMEITDPGGDPDSVWYVTNGLLVNELITGRMQTGDATFEQYAPADVNVAGDPDDPDSPTYASLAPLLDEPPLSVGSVISQALDPVNGVVESAFYEQFGVQTAYLDPVTDHAIAEPFWEFMNATGTVYQDGLYLELPLFEDPFFATGRPVTEAYWAEVQVGGTPASVLMQCFERRCLTYTPNNPEGWQVEAGNVGRHYYAWRYGDG